MVRPRARTRIHNGRGRNSGEWAEGSVVWLGAALRSLGLRATARGMRALRSVESGGFGAWRSG
eukprot:1025675-Prymnesium_polylepis.1